MTNPFLSTDEASAFWREQRQACEEARRLLIKTPEFAAFLAVGGKIDVVPMPLPAKQGYAAMMKDGDRVIGAVYFVVNIECDAVIIPYTFGPYMVEQFSAWLSEAKGLTPKMDNRDAYHYMPANGEGGQPWK